MNKTRRKKSGMTLIECIIAIAVFALLSVVLLLIGTSVDAHSRSARNINKKISVEGPVAEAQDKDTAVEAGNVNVSVKFNGTSGTQTITVPATAYEVYQDPADVVVVNGTVVTDPADKNFKFLEIPVPTAPPTTAAAAP